MPSLVTEHDLKRCESLGFCYLCGQAFGPTDDINRDHVPPNAIFGKPDRVQPLILPAHKSCNGSNSQLDEQVGQLMSLMHRAPLDKKHVSRLELSFYRVHGSRIPAGALKDFPFQNIVFRWLRAFHAALYREYLPPVGGYIHPPFPEGDPSSNHFEPIPPIHAEYVKTIKRNRVANRTDKIISRNGKMRYECVWAQSDNRAMNLCIFALDLYDWRQLGDMHHAPARSCVGIYTPSTIPVNASRDTKLDFPFANSEPLNAFGL